MHARVLSLTVLALEELAKPPLLWALNPEDDPKKWKTFWVEQFSRHGTKQQMITAYGAVTGLRREIYWFELNGETVKALARIQIDRSRCAHLYQELEILGVQRLSVFPDLDSVASWVCSSHQSVVPK